MTAVGYTSRLRRSGTVPGWAPWAAYGAASVLAVILSRASGINVALLVVAAIILAGTTIYLWSRAVEGSRRATDRVATLAVTSTFAIAMVPLVSLLATAIQKGSGRFDFAFFTESLRNVVGDGGGAVHAIIGTLVITGFATFMAVPIGILTAVYLREYGAGRRLALAVTFFVDVMTGIPSIVAGLFAYALFALFLGPGVRLGIVGAVALTVLMIPIVVRATEEMLRIVPNGLREAAYALGIPKWKTIVRVVLPTALGGIITGVMLAVARVVGETAPLLVTTGVITSVNWNPFEGRMMNLSVFAYFQYKTPGVPARAVLRARVGRCPDADHHRARALLRGAPRVAALGQNGDPEIVNTEAQTEPATREVPPAMEASSGVSIEVTDLNLYYGSFLAVEGVSMAIERNKATALIGASGCGKSTFLRSLNRMHELVPGARAEGHVRLEGEDTYAATVDPVSVRRRIGMVFQAPNPFPTMSIYDNVAAGLKLNTRRVKKSDLDAVVERSLKGANLWEEVKNRLGKSGTGLSGGQQQRLCIARAIAVEPEVLLMDEPASALDPISTLAIEDLVQELKRDYTIVIVTHNMQQASRASDITGFFNIEAAGQPGRLVEMGATEKIFTNPENKATEDYVSGRFG